MLATTGIWRASFFSLDQIVHAVDVGEVYKKVRLDKHRQLGGERVVFAETNFFHSNGVVLVDDGHDAAVEKLKEGVPEVKVAFFVAEVVPG